jgi:glutamate/aspartate transport system substrate-binding protein
MKAALISFSILAGLASLSTHASATSIDTLSRVRDTQTLVIAYREASIPFSFMDESKQVTGYAVELCQKVADAVKRELKLPKLNVQYLAVDSKTRFSAIIDGKADLECGSTTNNADRRTRVAFTVPHFFSSVRALVRANEGIRNWPDLRNKTVAITKSTTTIQLLNDRNNVQTLNIKVLEGESDLDSFTMVEQKKADVFAMDDVLLYGLRAQSKHPENFAIIGEPLSIEPYSIMLRKDDAAFKKVVDTEMVRMVNDGELNKIYDKWFMHPFGAKGINMKMPMGFVLRDSLRFPSDKVGIRTQEIW